MAWCHVEILPAMSPLRLTVVTAVGMKSVLHFSPGIEKIIVYGKHSPECVLPIDANAVVFSFHDEMGSHHGLHRKCFGRRISCVINGSRQKQFII